MMPVKPHHIDQERAAADGQQDQADPGCQTRPDKGRQNNGQAGDLERAKEPAPESFRQGPVQPGQEPAGHYKQVPHQPDEQYPRTQQAGDKQGGTKHKGQECIDFHVKAGAEFRFRSGPASHPPVQSVEDQHHQGQSGKSPGMGKQKVGHDECPGNPANQEGTEKGDSVGPTESTSGRAGCQHCCENQDAGYQPCQRHGRGNLPGDCQAAQQGCQQETAGCQFEEHGNVARPRIKTGTSVLRHHIFNDYG